MEDKVVLIPFVRYEKGAHHIEKSPKGDWYDVFANETVILYKGDHKYISLGFAMQLPKGYEAYIAPRSSTFKTWGLLIANSIGIVDNSYCGNDDIWKVSVYCVEPRLIAKPKTLLQKILYKLGFKKRYTVIHKGDKIAQIRLMECMPEVEFVEVDKLEGKNRTGFGSTGTR